MPVEMRDLDIWFAYVIENVCIRPHVKKNRKTTRYSTERTVTDGGGWAVGVGGYEVGR